MRIAGRMAMTTNDPHSTYAVLRMQAQARAQALDFGSERRKTMTPEEARDILHELHVHQIELEMQNEELRRAQVELDATRARYFDLYDLAPVGYCTLSAHGLIVQSNLTAAALLGQSRHALIKQPISRFIFKADQDIYYTHHKLLQDTGEAQSCALRMLKPDGTPFWVSLLSSNAQDSDGIAVHRIVLIDVSDHKRLEAELLSKNAELADARRVADKANLAKSEFLSSMSHELRSPLNAILGFAQLLESGSPAPTPSQQGRIGHILKAGWYLLALINEILDLAVVESGKAKLTLEAVSLPDLLPDCQAMVEPQAQSSGIQISFAPLDGPCFVMADRTGVKQVLTNLLSNAIKYNRPGGRVDVAYITSTPGRMRINVRDTGAGLPPDQLTQLFQPFNRLGQENGAVQGTGIGLVVSKRLVELMGGSIGVQSTVGLGSEFWFELNLIDEPQANQMNPDMLSLDMAPLNEDAELHTLLCVEDNRANLELMQQIIARQPNMRMLSAEDGYKGIALARSQHPRVILLDINLPGISGYEALTILQNDPVTQHIPVLALSANAIPRDIERGLAAGFFAYLTKPIKLPEFMAALNQALALNPPR